MVKVRNTLWLWQTSYGDAWIRLQIIMVTVNKELTLIADLEWDANFDLLHKGKMRRTPSLYKGHTTSCTEYEVLYMDVMQRATTM